jgi:putative transposase
VGWELSRAIDTPLTLAALDQALTRRHPASGLIHHSDRGVQYASAACIARLTDVGAQVSMSADGNPYDKAKAETFFKTLKREEVYLAEENVGRFIGDVYNAKRLHLSLGYVPPIEFEDEYVTTLRG